MAFLHSIRLRGFKTFARPTELVFEPGVTVIIGPNGSGKSNVADAVLWVLGEQSPGNLRGRTMQDVIFSGPDGKRSSAVAEVALVFDNACGSLPMDCSQVEITRRLMRDGTSEYRINGAGCRLLDVQDLVGGLGLGREMHSVISQGKVEALLNSTPAARRALVEEAAGLGRFKKRRERTQLKLEKVGQNLLRVTDVEREVRNALRPLRQQVAAAERYAQSTEEWAHARAKLVLLDALTVQDACREKEEVLAGLRARLAGIERQLAELRGRRAAEEELFSKALQEREELGVAHFRMRSEAERLDGRALSLRQRVARIEGELDRARRRAELAESELSASVARLGHVSPGSGDEARLNWVTGVARALKSEIEAMLPLFRAAQADEEEAKDAVFELEASRARGLQERDYLRREVTDRARISRELEGLKAAAQARIRELAEKMLELEKRRAESSRSVAEAITSVELAQLSREEKRTEVENASREEARLSELAAGVESRGAVLEQVLERKEGLPAGARDLLRSIGDARVLTDLLTVEPGYERALAAALGPIVHAVVVPGPPDLSTALQGVGLLEIVWTGEALTERVAGEVLPAGARDLWDLVGGPREVTAALRRLAPRVAVVDGASDLLASETASLAAEGWCFVTRNGEVAQLGVHAARRSEAGAEALLSARGELEKVVGMRRGLDAELEGVRGAKREALVAVERVERAWREAEERLRELERMAFSEANEADLLSRRSEEAGAQLEELAARDRKESELADQMATDLIDLERAIAARESALEQAKEALRQIQSQLESHRVRVGRAEEKRSQAALIEVRLRERWRAHQQEVDRARAQHDAAGRELARCTRRVDAFTAYMPVLGSMQHIVEGLASRVRSAAGTMEAQVAKVRSRSEEAARVVRDWGGAEAELQQQHDALAADIAEVQVQQVRVFDRRTVLEEELASLRQRHLSPRSLRAEDVAGEDRETLLSAIERAERRREKIGPINPLAEQECREGEERAAFLAEQRRDLEASMAQLNQVIGELDDHINDSFAQIFNATKEHFASVVATVFPGARGTLTLTEPVEGESEGEGGEDAARSGEDTRGIMLEVRFPNKAPRSMSLLSGGEKAMTAIAFLFSLFLARPCPFYILDEVEASLDDLNIRRFLALIRKYGDRTQFIVITHQRQTMEVADTLYGVALESDGTSRVLSRRFRSGERGMATGTGAVRRSDGLETERGAPDRDVTALGA